MTRDEIERVFLRWYKPLCVWLRNKVGGHAAQVDDLAQEVFVRLLKYADGSAPIENEQGYIFRVAANVASEWRERAAQSKPHFHIEADADLADSLIEHGGREPHTTHEAEDYSAALERVVDQLPVRHVQVLRLHIHESLTYNQIAKKLKISPRMVLRDLTRAYTRLRELADPDGVAAPPSAQLIELREQEAKRLTSKPVRAPLNPRRIRQALIENDCNLKATANALECSESTVVRYARMLPDYKQLRKQARIFMRSSVRNRLLAALEKHNYQMQNVAKAIGRSEGWMWMFARDYVPDLDEKVKAYKARVHEQKRADVREAVVRANAARGQRMLEYNRARWANAEERLQERIKRLGELDEQMLALKARQQVERAVFERRKERVLAALEKRRVAMRSRQTGEMQIMWNRITSVRGKVPGYKQLAKRGEGE